MITVNSTLDLKLLDPVVGKAQTWGFICQRQSAKGWLILPQQANRRWKLQQDEERWILLMGDVPQLRLHTEEAILFLEARRLENS
ncbi:hypothetical protein [Myxosarcina sp. GI1(2024)]